MKTLQHLSLATAILCAVAASSPSAHAQILGFDVDFNGSADTYTDNFKRWATAVPDDPQGFTWGADVGTGDSGGLAVTNTGANNLFYRPSDGNGSPGSDATSTFDIGGLAANTTFNTSIDFQWSNTTATDLTVLSMGFTTGRLQNSITSTGSLAGSLIRNGSSSVTLRLVNNGSAVANTFVFDQSAFTLNSWYQLSYDITKDATLNQFSYTVSLFSIGADGTSPAVALTSGGNPITISGTVSNSGIYGDSDAFFAYDIRNTNGISHVDNFSVAVPEPTTGSLLGIGLGMLVLSRRHRRRG